MRRFVWSVIVLIALACGLVPPAYANSYINVVASHLGSSHVWQDPEVSIVSATELATLDGIVTSSGKPIYVAIVNQSKMPSNDSSSYPKYLFEAVDRDGAFVVIGLKAFRAAGFNTSYEVAKRTPEIATAAFNNAKARGATKPDYQAINELVTGLAGLDFTKPAAGPAPEQPASPPSSSGSADLSWLWWVFGIAVVAIVGVLAWMLFVSESDGEESHVTAAPMPAQDLTQNDYSASSNDWPVMDNVSDEQETAAPPPPPVAPVRAKKRRRRRSSTGSNSSRQYRTYQTSSPSHPHYWGGGMYNGVQYPAGYYASDFWLGYVLGQMNDGSHHHHSQPDTWTSQSPSREEPRNEERTPVSSSSYDSGYGGGGDFGGSSYESSEPVYRAPSPPSPRSPDTPPSFSSSTSSYSSSDSGGFDFGSSSGGGYSSGSSGGGDF